jgi:hypothetical protein
MSNSATGHDLPDLSKLSRDELIARLEKYLWFKPETEASIYLLLRSLKSADEQTARRICNDIENHNISCEAGPLANCSEWIELRRKVGAPSSKWS